MPEFVEIARDQACPVCGHKRRCKRDRTQPEDLILCFRETAQNANGFRLVKSTRGCSTYVRVGSPADSGSASVDGVKSQTNADLDADARRFAARVSGPQVEALADELGVTPDSVRSAGVGFDGQHVCFPERDAHGNVVGICRRYPDGTKRVGKGERRGLIVPYGLDDLPAPVLIVEGASDVAACLSMGLTAVGRPNNLGGANKLARLLRRRREVLIVGERDEKLDGSWPGREGAVAVSRALARSWDRAVPWALPPDGSKDVREFLRQYTDGVASDPDTLRAAGRELLAELRAAAVAVGPEADPTDSLPEESGPKWYTIDELARRPTYREGLAVTSTGFATLDKPLRGGFRSECFYVLAGRTGSAKSTLALNITRRVALGGDSVLLFKLEESPVEAVWRIHAAVSQVALDTLLDGAGRADTDRERLIDGWNLIKSLPVRIAYQRSLPRLEMIAREHANDGGKLIVIDQLTMVEVPGQDAGYVKATEVSNRLRLLARDLHVPILAVAQVNRPAARSADRLTIHDLRDSGCIENDAAAVILIDAVQKPDAPRWHTDPLTLEILIGKNRYGRMTGPKDSPLELLWWAPEGRIEDPAKDTRGGQ